MFFFHWNMQNEGICHFCFKGSAAKSPIVFSQNAVPLKWIWAQNMFKMFSLVCSKTCQLRKLRQNECLLFNFCMIKLTKTPILPNLQVPNVLFCIIVNFITPKIEK